MNGSAPNTHNHQPIRVLQIVDSLGMGGAETWLMELLRFWQASGNVQADILLTSGNTGSFDEEAADLGAKLFYCRYGRNRLAQFVKNFRQILREGDYDAVHDHQDYTSGWHLLAAAGCMPPVRVAHVHNPASHITVNYATSPARRLTAGLGRLLVEHLATNICGTSATILREYGFEPDRRRRPSVSVAHCGFTTGRFNAPREADRRTVREEFQFPHDARIVLFAGRLDRAMEFDHPQNHKNSWFALNVMKILSEQQPRTYLLMAGAGDEMRVQLETVVAAWGLSGQLRLVGVRHDMPRLMRASDVLFFPSRQEGLGMVAVEAQAAGLPVLASTAVPRECVVLPNMVDFMPLNCDLNEWAAKLDEIMEKSKVPIDQCDAALRSSAFSIERSAATLEAIYAGEITPGMVPPAEGLH